MFSREMICPVVALLALVSCAGLAEEGPDTLLLEDGRTLKGTVLEETAEGVKFKMGSGSALFRKGEIKSLQRGEAGAPHAGDLRDVLVLADGVKVKGLFVAESAEEVVFDAIASGLNVTKTILVRNKYPRAEVREIKKLTDEQRVAVLAYLEQVRSQERADKYLIQAVEIKPHTWPNKDRKGKPVPAGLVELDHFIIESTTPEEFFQECAYRLARVYAAYQEHFKVERNSDKKVRVLIFDSMEQYYGAIDNMCKNPAFYATKLNLVCAGCEYHLYKKATESIRAEFSRVEKLLEKRTKELEAHRSRINKQVADINTQIRKASADPNAKEQALSNLRASQIRMHLELGRYQKEVDELQEKMDDFKKRLAAEFETYTTQMFQMLYHEGFHAFLQNFLFDAKRVEKVPLWLNEGLAQYFELARIESDRMILGKEDRERMAQLRKWNKDGGLVKLTDLIVSESKHFMVRNAAAIEQSTKHYLQSWFLVHWLGQNNRLSQKNLNGYVDALLENKPPGEALQLLTGIPNTQLQKILDETFKYNFELKE